MLVSFFILYLFWCLVALQRIKAKLGSLNFFCKKEWRTLNEYSTYLKFVPFLQVYLATALLLVLVVALQVSAAHPAGADGHLQDAHAAEWMESYELQSLSRVVSTSKLAPDWLRTRVNNQSEARLACWQPNSWPWLQLINFRPRVVDRTAHTLRTTLTSFERSWPPWWSRWRASRRRRARWTTPWVVCQAARAISCVRWTVDCIKMEFVGSHWQR